MRRPGVLRTLSILSGFVLAVPMAIVGFEFLTQGRTAFGVAFLVLALALLFLPEYLLSQIPGPREYIRSRLSRSEEE